MLIELILALSFETKSRAREAPMKQRAVKPNDELTIDRRKLRRREPILAHDALQSARQLPGDIAHASVENTAEISTIIKKDDKNDYDSLKEFVGNHFDRVGGEYLNFQYVYQDDDSDDLTSSIIGISCLSKMFAPKTHEKPAVDTEFAAKLGDAAFIKTSHFGNLHQLPVRPRHDGMLRVGTKKQRNTNKAAILVKKNSKVN